MQEQIGNVTLDLTWYPGEDLYSDGEIEEQLLELARTLPEGDFGSAKMLQKDWTLLYHFSPIRERILDPVLIRPTDRVLEIGAGCGAVTGALARRAESVTCIELSRRRSQINAWRHRSLGNINILVGNFQQIEPQLTEKYDLITLIGVFEYAKGYISSDDPYADFLRRIRSHLKEDGRLIIAIENRLGLKYWAGSREDHTGRFFDGLENYPNSKSPARTFSRTEIEQVFARSGFESSFFYYPYPDYKLPLSIYSDRYPPRKGELKTNLWNFDRDRIVLFDEGAAFDALIESGQFGDFSNSFLVSLRKTEGKRRKGGKASRNAGGRENEEIIYSRFSTERAEEYGLITRIVEKENGERELEKQAASPEANAHIDRMAAAEKKLSEEFAPSGLSVNRVLRQEESAGCHKVRFQYLSDTVTLEAKAGSLLMSQRHEEAADLIRELTAKIRSAAGCPFKVTDAFRSLFGKEQADVPWPADEKSLPFTDLDMVAENVLADDEAQTLTDYEWICDYPVPVSFLIWRVWHYFYARFASAAVPSNVLAAEGIGPDLVPRFERMEAAWQKKILGDVVPLRDLYHTISPGTRDMRSELSDAGEDAKGSYTATLFYGQDDQFISGGRCCQSWKMGPGGAFSVTFRLPETAEKVRYMRFDPAEQAVCRVKISSVRAEELITLTPLNGFREDGEDTFWTLDPAYRVEGDLSRVRTVTVEGRLELINLNDQLAAANQTKLERDAYLAELTRIRSWADQTRGTIGYKGIEGLRRGRNYVMARVQGTKLFSDPDAVARLYGEWFAAHSVSEEQLASQRKALSDKAPFLSLIVPIYRTPEAYLRAMIDSVLAQSYENWELCLADGSEDGSVTQILEDYAARDKRIRFQTLEKNLGISGNTNAAAAMAGGDYLVSVDHDDLITPDALFEFASAICRTGAACLYSDEDKISMDGSLLFDPNLKPDFSPDLLRSHNYITHLFAVSRQLFDRVGGYRSAYDGAQDYDLILRCTEVADQVVHIPRVLYHWRTHPGSTSLNPKGKLYAYEAGRRAVEAHLKRLGLKGSVTDTEGWGLLHVTYETLGDPLISVIIPNMDHVKDLDRCIRSVAEKNVYPNLEILVVENNSVKQETFRYYRSLVRRYPCVRILRWKKAFNYAAINNFAVRHARGRLLLLLNNDTKMISPDSIKEMAGLALREDTGCVGAKLLYADGTIQHAGVILGPGGFAGHVFSGLKKDAPGFMMRPLVTGNYSAVTGACLMVKKELYEEAGGMSEEFAVALNDVDFCLKLRAKGYVNVFTPFSVWYHYESKSRGYETTPERRERFDREVALFKHRWKQVLAEGDPYYHPAFDLEKAPFQWW